MVQVDDLVLADLGGREIYRPALHPDAVLLGALHGPVNRGRLQQFLGRDAATVQTGAAHLFFFDQGYAQTGQPAVKRGRIASWTTPDDYYIKRLRRRAVVTTTFLTPSLCARRENWPHRTRVDGRLGVAGAMLGRMRRPCQETQLVAHAALGVSVVSVLAAGTGARRLRRAAPPHVPRQARPAPIDVVVSVYPLAQLTSYVGGTAVHVVDLAPPGTQPQGLSLNAAQREEIERAAVVIDVGDGYQPDVESTASSARRHLSVLPEVSKQAKPYEFWLDPYLMADAATAIAEALAAAEPAERTVFEDGSRNFGAVASSIESDSTARSRAAPATSSSLRITRSSGSLPALTSQTFR